MADMSGFSRYVRDTPDDAIVRESLTNFYAKSRYLVINAGGMLQAFIGDEVLALFGIPDRRTGYVEAAVQTACRLLDLGESVSHHWQRQIDHVQPYGGVHIGMAMGRVQLVAQRALDHSRLATIGDCLNLTARLVALAGPGQIMVSNVLHHALEGSPYDFVEQSPIEARNLGTVRPWQLLPPATLGGLN
jgi:adenylate cyclase